MTEKMNQTIARPDLQDVLNLLKRDILLNLNSHHIGKIQSFDSTTQTAKATIVYKKVFSKRNALTGIYNNELIDYPILLDCPVIFLGGGLASLTFPITAGDECLVLFNDRDIDNWYKGGSGTGPATARLHSMADGLIIVGVRSLATALTGFDTDSVTLRYGTANKVQVFTDKIVLSIGSILTLEINATGKFKVTGSLGEFVSSISKLFDDVQTGTVTTLLGPQPLVMPTFTADKLILDSFKA